MLELVSVSFPYRYTVIAFFMAQSSAVHSDLNEMDFVRLRSMGDTPFGLSIIVVAGIITWIAYFYSRQ